MQKNNKFTCANYKFTFFLKFATILVNIVEWAQ